jgi:hypothetical protein
MAELLWSAEATVKNFDTLGRFRKADETAQQLNALAGSAAIEIFPQQIACLMQFATSGGGHKSKRRTQHEKFRTVCYVNLL